MSAERLHSAINREISPRSTTRHRGPKFQPHPTNQGWVPHSSGCVFQPEGWETPDLKVASTTGQTLPLDTGNCVGRIVIPITWGRT